MHQQRKLPADPKEQWKLWLSDKNYHRPRDSGSSGSERKIIAARRTVEALALREKLPPAAGEWKLRLPNIRIKMTTVLDRNDADEQ